MSSDETKPIDSMRSGARWRHLPLLSIIVREAFTASSVAGRSVGQLLAHPAAVGWLAAEGAGSRRRVLLRVATRATAEWCAKEAAYPYTYPAVVLKVHSSQQYVFVLYLSDGMSSDSGDETRSQVPIGHVTPCRESTRFGWNRAHVMPVQLERVSQGICMVEWDKERWWRDTVSRLRNELQRVRVRGLRSTLRRMCTTRVWWS